jgi:hemoglobin
MVEHAHTAVAIDLWPSKVKFTSSTPWRSAHSPNAASAPGAPPLNRMQSDGFIASEGNIISVDELDVYALVGEEGFARLIAAFYRQVPGDPILGPMYPPDDPAGAEERLRDFLVGRFGGPQRYMEQRGHPRLRARHMPFAVNAAARERWLQLMGRRSTTPSCRPRPTRCCASSSWRCRRC